MDFFNVLKYISRRDPYNYGFPDYQAETAYPPFAYLLLYPFSRIADAFHLTSHEMLASQLGLMALLGFLFLSVFPFLLILFTKKDGSLLVKSTVLITFMSTGVFMFSIERGNTILLAVFLLSVFLLGYRSENRFLRELSYIALACAAALKVYPALFGVLLLRDKRFSDCIRTMIYGASAFFLPFLFFTNGFMNFPIMMTNASLNANIYKLQDPTYRLGFVAFCNAIDPSRQNVDSWLTVGNVFLAISILLCLFLRCEWKAVMLISCAIIAAPANSGYYCALYLFVPILLFLNQKEHAYIDWLYLSLMLLILNPFQIIDQNMVLHTGRVANIALILLMILLITDGLITVFIKFKHSSKRKNAIITQES